MLVQPRPNSDSLGYKQTEFDNLSDEELMRLINSTGKVRVAQQAPPVAKREVNLDQYLGGGGAA